MIFSCSCTQTMDNEIIDPKYFYIKIEQDGKEIPIMDHIVELKKTTFTIIIGMKNTNSVLLTCSKSDKSYGLFANDTVEIKDIPAYQNSSMAERLLNDFRDIIICSDAPSGWFYENDTTHRFEKIELEDEWIIGRRTIENYRDCDEGKAGEIDKLDKSLYLTFLHFAQGSSYLDRIPLQKEYFIIKWK